MTLSYWILRQYSCTASAETKFDDIPVNQYSVLSLRDITVNLSAQKGFDIHDGRKFAILEASVVSTPARHAEFIGQPLQLALKLPSALARTNMADKFEKHAMVGSPALFVTGMHSHTAFP